MLQPIMSNEVNERGLVELGPACCCSSSRHVLHIARQIKARQPPALMIRGVQIEAEQDCEELANLHSTK